MIDLFSLFTGKYSRYFYEKLFVRQTQILTRMFFCEFIQYLFIFVLLVISVPLILLVPFNLRNLPIWFINFFFLFMNEIFSDNLFDDYTLLITNFFEVLQYPTPHKVYAFIKRFYCFFFDLMVFGRPPNWNWLFTFFFKFLYIFLWISNRFSAFLAFFFLFFLGGDFTLWTQLKLLFTWWRTLRHCILI